MISWLINPAGAGMDSLLWKLLLIVGTGLLAFGALTVNRDPVTNKLTIVGWAYAFGIVAVTIVAFVMQFAEFQNDAKEAKETAKATHELAVKTAQIVSNTSTAVAALERSLAPLDATPILELTLAVPCQIKEFEKPCREMLAKRQQHLPITSLASWPVLHRPPFSGWLTISDTPYVRMGTRPIGAMASWEFTDAKPIVSSMFGTGIQLILRTRLEPFHNMGKIQSALDFRGLSVSVAGKSKVFEFAPVSLQLLVGGGQRVVLDSDDLVQRTYGDRGGPTVARGYVHTFDSKKDPRLINEYNPVLYRELMQPARATTSTGERQ